MGLSKRAVGVFSRVADRTAREVWPGVLLVVATGVEYECACTGGRRERVLDENGLERTEWRHLVRVAKATMEEASRPGIGDQVEWTPEGGGTRAGRVVEYVDRPGEESWGIEISER